MLDLPPALPSALDQAPARGVVALREPLGERAVRELVEAVMQAWVRESADELSALLTSDAGPFEARSRGRSALLEGWRQRMQAHAYGRLAGVDLVRPERIERYSWSELSPPSPVPRPPEMRPDEVYVRVPIEVPRLAGERLFGDVLVLLLRRDGPRYRIAAYGEAPTP